MTAAALPPRPDPVTGEPPPPRAPTVAGAWSGFPEKGRRTHSHRPGQEQRWFSHREPILELAQARRRHALRFAAGWPLLAGLGLVAFLVVFELVNYARTDNYPLAGQVRAWGVIVLAVIAGYTAIRYLQHRRQLVYAGAGWAGEGSGRAECVTTYDLARIVLTGDTLHLTGPDGRELALPLGLLEGSPPLWDLVHNGLRHSAAAGAEVDPATRERLRLP